MGEMTEKPHPRCLLMHCKDAKRSTISDNKRRMHRKGKPETRKMYTILITISMGYRLPELLSWPSAAIHTICYTCYNRFRWLSCCWCFISRYNVCQLPQQTCLCYNGTAASVIHTAAVSAVV